MKNSLIIALIMSTFFSCEKDNTSSTFSPFYKVTVNGETNNVYACGTSNYVCEYLKDTAMFVGIQCGGQWAGFYLKGKIIDGTYKLDNINQAFYGSNTLGNYKTNADNKGTLTITSGKVNHTIILKGVFEFQGIDTTTRKVLTFSKGSFLMEKVQF